MRWAAVKVSFRLGVLGEVRVGGVVVVGVAVVNCEVRSASWDFRRGRDVVMDLGLVSWGD
jgi:hypothetical protein